ncbi:hypothetical protein E2C01_015056 [Portunus trituberculatus]|uniref:Integrase zinc-binding domain-containing protein n=1 Tax=Portunus trituberculatus TaxID=210409 RepID=A0A5B7DKN4_PORTR|nr:hypothetical protein [Portunus trituberculatus]
MLRRARQCIYWPGLEGDLQHYRASCTSYETHALSQPSETLIITPPPEYPFQSTVADMFQHERHSYMVYADRLTGWLELTRFPNGNCVMACQWPDGTTRWTGTGEGRCAREVKMGEEGNTLMANSTPRQLRPLSPRQTR